MRVPEYPDPIQVRWYKVPPLRGAVLPLTDYSSSNWDEDRSYDPPLGEQSTLRMPYSDWVQCVSPLAARGGGGGGSPSSRQGIANRLRAAVGGGGSPSSPQQCGGSQVVGGPLCSSAVVGTLNTPYQTDQNVNDQWYRFVAPPAGTYTFWQHCDLRLPYDVYTGVCSDLIEQFDACPTAPPGQFGLVFALDGATDVYVFFNTSLYEPPNHAVWAVRSEGCPGGGFVLTGGVGGGGSPSSPQRGIAPMVVVGSGGGGGSPSSDQFGQGTLPVVGSGGGGGSPSSNQFGM